MTHEPDASHTESHTNAPDGPVPPGQLSLLAELSGLLSVTSDPRATLGHAMELGARLVPDAEQWRVYTVGTADPDAAALLLVFPPGGKEPVARDIVHRVSTAPAAGHGGSPATARGGHASLGLGATNDRRVLRQRQTVILGRGNASASHRASSAATRRARPAPSAAPSTAAHAAVVAHPLSDVSGALVGALVAVAGPRHAWQDDELCLIEVIAHHLGILVARSTAAPENATQREAQAGPAADERLEFISLAAHELRSPLATIKGYAQLLLRAARKDAASNVNALRSLHSIDQQISRMTDLIGELLDMVRIQRGTLEVYPHAIELEPIVRHVVDQRRELTDRHSITLEAPPSPLLGMWDAERTEQIVRDLLDNAARFSPRGGAIAVRLAREGAMARLCVSDQGIGVPADERERIFDAYYRGEQAHQRHLAGLGLGLFVSQAIAERMGGRLWLAASDESGGGSQFCLELPLA